MTTLTKQKSNVHTNNTKKNINNDTNILQTQTR